MDVTTPTKGHLEAFREIVGESYVLDSESDASQYLQDWTGEYTSAPVCVVFPASTREVSELLSYCSKYAVNVVPQGGNTGLVGGCLAKSEQAAVLVNLRRLNKIRRMDAQNYTMEVEAGCIVQNLQSAAEEAGRLFPLSFGAQGSAQIGGAIATNAGGLNVLRYGMVRELLLGLEVVLYDGTIVNGLSRLRKDNRGPDLKQLFVGSEGTFGIVTAASFKLFPLPTQRETALLALNSIDDVVALYGLAREHCADLLSAFEIFDRRCLELAIGHQDSLRDPLPDSHDFYVLMDLAASGMVDLRQLMETFLERAMENALVLNGALAESVAQAQSMWAIREAMVEAQAAHGRHLRTDISVPVSEVPAFVHNAYDILQRKAPDWNGLVYGHIGDGNIHFNALPPTNLDEVQVQTMVPELLQAFYLVLESHGGSLSAEHGIGRSRRDAFERDFDPAQLLLGRRVKDLLDPRGIMNPGCLFSDTGTDV